MTTQTAPINGYPMATFSRGHQPINGHAPALMAAPPVATSEPQRHDTATDTPRDKNGIDWPRVWTLALGGLAAGVATIGTVAVAVAGFTLSYDAIRAVGVAARIRAEWSWLLPVSIDGAMAVASVAAVVLRRVTDKTSYYAWVVVAVGVVVSVACNMLHAVGLSLGDETRAAVSAIPPVMLALSLHLLVLLIQVSYVKVADRDTDGAEPVAATSDNQQVAAPAAPRLSHTTYELPAPSGVASDGDTEAPPMSVGRGLGSSRSTTTARPRRATPSLPSHRDTDGKAVARRRVAAGESCAAVAASLGVSTKSVERWTSDIRAQRQATATDKETS